jgi:hypothetical protein
MGALLYTITLHAAAWEIVMLAEAKYGMRFSTLMMAATLLGPGLVAHAQDRPYKVDFTIRDTGDAGGKTGRKFSLLVSSGRKTTFKVGNRVPVVTGSAGSGGNVQFTYVDVGINIDCSVSDNNSNLTVHADLDISTAVTPEKGASAAPAPTISQIRLSLDTALTPGKPTVVASFDDPVTSRKFDVDVAITKM